MEHNHGIDLRERVRGLVLGAGAALCGFAPVDRFDAAREGHHPRDLFADCQSVIVLAIPLPLALLDTAQRMPYTHFNSLSADRLDGIALDAANAIERALPCRVLPLPSDGPYDDWDEAEKRGRGLLSVKHAAVAAGLGQLGKSTLLLNEEYGNLLTVGALLTDLVLPGDPPARSICLPDCRRCIDNCPAQALDGVSAIQKRCRAQAYGTNARGFFYTGCAKCRLECPMAAGRRGRTASLSAE